ncbi:sigma-54-dependent Fis family transcriptional regulator [Sphingomonas panacisoli]|uniref:Sigma-54-dependent Fis family transcriptional regulator n=1 Tax=Sphingomonas panacisoli TaxID=1813879 RepID=A0A5B8LJU2_9SPHN|nr:sigma-54 dependent transcriptional regulator [Sphingomonas panacisoli]QDZ08256.1 sigma-54-dependent Fis family transcriptional regulator [Sphingomonas panacisoli]
MSAGPVIFVEDDDELRRATLQALELAEFDVRAFARADEAVTAVTRDFAGIVVTDIRMPYMDGLELLTAVRAIDPDIPVILITGHGDIAMAVGAMRDGAADFLTKPFAADHLAAAVRRSLAHRALVMDNRHLRALADAPDPGEPLIGESPPMLRLRQVIRQLADADIDVLVEGETGTGKELVATMLHRQGPRRARPLIAVNCGALPDGLAEIELFGHAADSVPHTRLSRTGQIAASSGGTLLLDEIDSMPLAMQARLLRVLEEREVQPIGADRPQPVDLRVVATSKVDLAEDVKAGRFRADLLYRLSTARVRVPALRERGDDVLALFAAFAGEAARQFGKADWRIDAATSGRLRRHDWPGNVRELRNAAIEAVLGVAEPSGAPRATSKSLSARVADYEAGEIRAALTASRGRVAPVLATLGLPRKTLYDKMTRLGISPRDFR